jgi:c(7)-type cytochrome triheme protein
MCTMPWRPLSPPRRAAAAALVLQLASQACLAAPAQWQRLEKDRLHDPKGPGIASLQQPGDALEALPHDTAGNLVNWVQAIDRGAINPRSNLLPGTAVRTLDLDIIVAKYGSMPAVKFPHRQHTLWLDCSNCHDQLFKPKAGANRLSMMAILNGEQCGLCHGAVSFPLTECNRCHSVPNSSLRPVAAPAAAPPSNPASTQAAVTTRPATP